MRSLAHRPVPLAAASLALAVGVASGCARPNPRVAQVVKQPADEDDDVEALTFTYGDAGLDRGRVTRVEKRAEGAVRTWDLAWDGDVLARVTVREERGAEVGEEEIALSYEGGRLVRASRADGAVAFTYDDQGRLVRAAGDDATARLEYGPDGQLAAIEDDSGDILLLRDDGRLEELTLDEDSGDDTSFVLEHDDAGRLAEITFDAGAADGFGGAAVVGRIAYTYDDDGRVAQVEQTATFGDIPADVATTTITYEEGEARGLDLAPNDVFLFGFLFDMKGAHHGTLDNTTTVPRLAFPSW